MANDCLYPQCDKCTLSEEECSGDSKKASFIQNLGFSNFKAKLIRKDKEFRLHVPDTAGCEDGILPEGDRGLRVIKNKREDSSRKTCFGVGILLTVLSALSTSTSGLIVKLAPFYGPQLTAVSGFVQAVLTFAVILYNKHTFFGVKGERWLLLGRSLFGGIAITCGFLAFQNLPLGDATTITYSSPVFVSLFAWIFLKEPCNISLCFTVIITISGLILVAQPSFLFGYNKILEKYPNHMEGIGYALGDMMSSVLVVIFLRLMKNTHYTAPVFGMSLGTFIIGSVTVVATNGFKMATTLQDAAYFAGVSVSALLSQLFFTQALQVEKAGPVSVAQSVIIVFAFIYQITVFDEFPDWVSVVGVCLITFGVLLTALKTIYDENPQRFCKFRK